MAISTQSAKPLEVLRQQITTLEAAITLALGDPTGKSVHLLRTSSRRIEAQLALLNLLARDSTTRPFRKSARRLRQLRRAASQVRDLDVATRLLEDPAALQTANSRQGAEEDLAFTASLHRHLVRDANALRKSLRHQRSAAANLLVAHLHHHGPALARSLEASLKSLAISEETSSLSISPARLAALTEDWVRRELPAEPDPDPTPKTLHGIRKVAKLARYMAESTPATVPLARTFEKLQETGGTWHDYLYIRGLARKELGKHSPLTQLLSRLTASSLIKFQAQLDQAPTSRDGRLRSSNI